MEREYLLFTDTHLDENPDNEYRWRVFDRIHEILDASPQISRIFCLGDFIDRKDRFSGEFVNRLITSVGGLGARRALWILKGNHDDPLRGPAFFEFVNGRVPGVTYVTTPDAVDNIVLLPFSPDPSRDWREIEFRLYRAAFMHATVTGAISESGYELTGAALPMLPRRLRLYSGDVHNPQTIRNLTYVGCPHPIRFGDLFQPRMLALDGSTLEIKREIPIQTIRKVVISIRSVEDLDRVSVSNGDQVRISVALPASDIDGWGRMEGKIAEWARSANITLVGTEVQVGIGDSRGMASLQDPQLLLRQFGECEGISEELMLLGEDLVREVI